MLIDLHHILALNILINIKEEYSMKTLFLLKINEIKIKHSLKQDLQ
jgi:hypothetical protein